MAKFRSQLNRVTRAEEITSPPQWEIGFKWQVGSIDQPNDIDIDFTELMRILGYSEAYKLFSTYFAVYPGSLGEPQHSEIDDFFDHLKNIELLDPECDGIKQCATTKVVYEKLLGEKV